jgi:hypothetical protein
MGSLGVAVYPAGVVTFVKREGRPRGAGGRRGVCLGFSRGSRRRMRKRLVLYNWRDLICQRRVLWIGLTARDGAVLEFKRWLDIFCKRLVRHWPGAWLTWRLEYQKRGMAHFHCLIVLPSAGQRFSCQKWVIPTWREIAGTQNTASEAQYCRRVHSIEGIAAYITDGCKVCQSEVQCNPITGEIEMPGRWWGQRGRVNEVRCRCIPRIVHGRGQFYFVRDLCGGIRRDRYEAIGRPRPFRRIKDAVEFFDTVLLDGFL